MEAVSELKFPLLVGQSPAISTNILEFSVRVLDSVEAGAGGWLPIRAYPRGSAGHHDPGF